MQMPPTSPDSLLEDSAAHSRLNALAATLANERQAMPDASSLTLATLNDELDRYWTTARRQLFIAAMQQSLADEVALKVHAGALHKEYARCVPEYATRFKSAQPDAYTLSLRVSEFDSVEIAGSLVFSVNDGATLLSLPGYGIEHFPSLAQLRAELVTALNIPHLRSELLSNTEQRHQDALLDTERDSDLFVETFRANDLILLPLAEPFEYALDSQLNKQYEDITYALGKDQAPLAHPQDATPPINAAALQDRFGPAGMLAQWAIQRQEREHNRQLPHWLKDAPTAELRTYLQSLEDYDQLRTVLASLMEGAASAEQFAQLRLRTRIASDLGYDLDPARVYITTQRHLPLTEETYETRRSLSELALYGLHIGDLDEGSAFLVTSHFSLDQQPLGDAYPSLTPAYIGALVEELDLRSHFGEVQRTTYGKSQVVQVMRQVTQQLILSEAHRSRLQAHLRPDDAHTLEDLGQPEPRTPSSRLQIQQIKLNERDVLSKVLLFRRLNADGSLDRLILFTPDSPRQRTFQGFDNERQLLQELVNWSVHEPLKHYLLEQVSPSRRKELNEQLQDLRLKAQPPANFLGFVNFISYSDALYALTTARIRVTLAEYDVHTPAWYLRASKAQRQELLMLEDAIKGAKDLYQAKPHTQVQSFDDFVHQRAGEKINALLGLPAGSVDPDQIIITSPRETRTYTQMLRDGYDDSLGFINASAAQEATFSGPDGIDLTALSPEKVAGSVRGAWLSDAYIAHINTTLLDPASEGYAWRRTTSLLITQMQMQAAALLSLLKGQISAKQYSWLQTSIGVMGLNDAHSRRQFPLDALQLRFESPLINSGDKPVDDALGLIVELVDVVTPVKLPKIYQVETVLGCYILTPFDNRDPQQALLYTPDAPDGWVFRPLKDFVNTLKRDGMSDYYKDRCRIKANRTLALMLIDMKKKDGTPPPALPATPLNNTLELCYDRALQRKIRNVEDTTQGRSDMLAKQIWNGIELVAIAVTLPFPLASFTVGALLALRDSGQALKALNEGDREAAGFFVLSSLLNTLGAWGDLHSGLKFFGGPLRQLARKTGEAPGLTNLKKRQALPQKGDKLQPVTLQGETFWAGKPGVKGHAPLFRAPPHAPEKLLATGRFTEKDVAGIWQPVHQQTHRALPNDLTAANPSYAVQHSLADSLPIESGHAKGTRTLNGNYYIKLDGQTFQVQYDAAQKFWQIIDPNSPFAFFGKQPVRLGTDGRWQVVDRVTLRGGVNTGFTPLEAADSTPTGASANPLRRYEMPAKWRGFIDGIVDPAVEAIETGDAVTGPFFSKIFKDGRDAYTALRKDLYDDATAFFDNAIQAAKPNLPLLDEAVTPDGLIQATLSNGNGMIISEAPGSVASKQFLIDNMGRLSLEDVDTLYIEHVLSDMHLQKLQKYQAKGGASKSGSHQIRSHLKHVNNGALVNESTYYDYYHLIKKAHEYGIEVRPLNSTVSYGFNTAPVPDAAATDPLALRKMSTFYGHRTILHDTTTVPGRRWVALLDQKIANTWQEAPGISELHGVVSVRIQDVAKGKPTRIVRDIDEADAAIATTRADFKVEIANPFINATPTPSTSSSPVPRPTDWLDRRLAEYLEGAPSTSPGGTFVNPYEGEHGFKLNSSGQWTRAEATQWQRLREPTAIQQSLFVPDYQIADELSTDLHQLTRERRGLDILYELTDMHLAPARNRFFSLRARLQRDATRGILEPLPARPVMPEIDAHLSQTDLLDRLYNATSGVVIAEKHSSVASKKFIIDNMPHLSQQKVKTLYLEHLQSDLHQLDLDYFAETGLMSKRLLHDLKAMDLHFHTDSTGVYTFEQLIIKAREHGLEVRAIDCAASYHLINLIGAAPTAREQMMNYFASRVIRRHQDVMGAHNWIALVGESHGNTFQKIVPGLAELEQGIGVRVFDVGPGESFGPLPDPGRAGTINLTTRAFVKQDFSLGLPTLSEPLNRLPLAGLAIAEVPVEVKLHSKGYFLIDESESSHPVIVHRSRHNLIERTPIQVNRRGKLYIERPSWRALHQKPFDNLPALIRALKEVINLRQVS